MQDGMMMGGPMMIMGLVLMALLLAAVIAAVVWGIRALTQEARTSHRPNPIAQLESRYARGEIDRDEYFQRRSDLEGG